MSPDFAFPDEDTFEMPASWRRVLRRRRGGLPGTPVVVDGRAAGKVRQWTEASRERITKALGDPLSDRGLAEEVRSHLAGRATPRGAAMLAHLLAAEDADDHSDVDDHAAFTDAWVSEHGLAFAVRAAVELCVVEIEIWWPGTNRRLREWRLCDRPTGGRVFWPWAWQPAVDRLRDLLADAGEKDYRVAVEALAECRRSRAQRIVASYLVPTETAWVDECCAEAPTGGYEHIALRTMLFCSLGSAGQVEALRLGLGFGQWSRGVLATLIDALGIGITPMLEGVFHHPVMTYADDRRVAVGVLSRLPTDEAFQLMLDHVDQKHVRPAVLESMRRYPVRALRLLAQAATGSNAAAELLSGHVRANPELTAAALTRLPAEARALVERISAETGDEAPRVEDAPDGALPPLLAEPPWTRRRKAGKPAVVTGLEPPVEPVIAWTPGVRETWAKAVAGYSHLREDDWEGLIGRYKAGQLIYIWEIGLFLNAPEHLVRPLVAGWRPSPAYGAEEWMKAAIARYELDVLPLALDIVAAETPAVCGELLLPFLDVRVARLMADWLARLKSARKIAAAWFAWHGARTLPLLVPDAAGPAGRARTNAEAALRHVAAAQGADAVVAAARAYGEEAATVVEALLAADPLDNLPARMPKIGEWLDPATMPQVLLRDRTRALPPAAAGHVLTMLALSGSGAMYPGLTTVREVCDRASLAEFGWEVFERWRTAGLPAKDGWALAALGWAGDDTTVRRLTPVIRAWPGEGGHQRAVTGLDVLAAIGSEIALMHLYDIAQRVPFKALKVRAREKIDEVADGLGLTSEQLADRLVPAFGLDESGSLLLDYGPRRFVVGFDEQLKPYVLDQEGKRRKSLPAPGARDDADQAPAARKRFADLKKDVRTVAAGQIRRLEAAMVARRDWSLTEFTRLFVTHPLTGHLARRLVWVAEADGVRQEFRVAEDRTLADVADRPAATPSDAARVSIAHPLHLTGTLAAWSELFADYEILQPFPQLGRAVHALTDDERTAGRLTRFEGVTVPTGKLLGLERRGWEREAPQDGGVQGQISRPTGDGHFVVIDLNPGIVVGDPEVFPEHRLETIWIDDRPDGYRSEATPRFGDLGAVAASEVLADLTELTELTT